MAERAEALRRQQAAIDEQIRRTDALEAEMAGLREALLAAEADLAHVHDVESDLAEAHSIVDSLRNVEQERDAAVRELDAVVRERDAALFELDAAVHERDAALRERDATVANHMDVIHSTSWRATAPLRRLGALARERRGGKS